MNSAIVASNPLRSGHCTSKIALFFTFHSEGSTRPLCSKINQLVILGSAFFVCPRQLAGCKRGMHGERPQPTADAPRIHKTKGRTMPAFCFLSSNGFVAKDLRRSAPPSSRLLPCSTPSPYLPSSRHPRCPFPQLQTCVPCRRRSLPPPSSRPCPPFRRYRRPTSTHPCPACRSPRRSYPLLFPCTSPLLPSRRPHP